MPEAPPSRPKGRSKGVENYPAYVGLCCGIASLVPWVFVLMFPLAVVFGVVGLVRAQRLPERDGRVAALMGMGIGLVAGVLHFALVGLGALIGMF